MPRLDLALKVVDTLQHVTDRHPTHGCPLAYYFEVLSANQRMFAYLDRHLSTSNTYRAPLERHMANLRRMALAQMIEGFERFLKHTAANCVDQLARFVEDDRFNKVGRNVPGDRLAQYFALDSVGRALCDDGIWLNNKEIRDRFGFLLRDAYATSGKWTGILGENEGGTHILSVLWQLRHTLAHNQGELIAGDVIKLRRYLAEFYRARQEQNPGLDIAVDHVLTPTGDDLRYIDRFLRDMSRAMNDSICDRLVALIDELHQDFAVPPNESREAAQTIKTSFDVAPITINGEEVV